MSFSEYILLALGSLFVIVDPLATVAGVSGHDGRMTRRKSAAAWRCRLVV